MPQHTPVRQNALTVSIPLRQGQAGSLRALFEEFLEAEGGIADNPDLPFSTLETVHFARFVVVEKSLRERGDRRTLHPPLLVYSSNYDGELDDHLRELVAAGPAWLHRVLSHCRDYRASEPDGPAMRAFLADHAIPYAGFYVGAVGLSVGQIRDEEALRQEIQTFLDARPDLRDAADAEAVRSAIREHLGASDFAWALEPPPEVSVLGTLPDGSFRLAGAAAIRLLLALVAVLLVVPALLLVFVFRRLENTDPIFPRTRYDARAQELAAREDQIVQNQLTILADMKEGRLRSFVLRTVFASINTLARFVFRRGRLGSIATIHFARWVILEDERAVLFFSNFTGSWEQYLGDFVDRAAVGLTGVWSNTVLFPRTRWLVFGGARDEEPFKAWSRAQQMVTDLWYSAYRDLSMSNILNNNAVRTGLGRELSPAETRAWVRRL